MSKLGARMITSAKQALAIADRGADGPAMQDEAIIAALKAVGIVVARIERDGWLGCDAFITPTVDEMGPEWVYRRALNMTKEQPALGIDWMNSQFLSEPSFQFLQAYQRSMVDHPENEA